MRQTLERQISSWEKNLPTKILSLFFVKSSNQSNRNDFFFVFFLDFLSVWNFLKKQTKLNKKEKTEIERQEEDEESLKREILKRKWRTRFFFLFFSLSYTNNWERPTKRRLLLLLVSRTFLFFTLNNFFFEKLN